PAVSGSRNLHNRLGTRRFAIVFSSTFISASHQTGAAFRRVSSSRARTSITWPGLFRRSGDGDRGNAALRAPQPSLANFEDQHGQDQVGMVGRSGAVILDHPLDRLRTEYAAVQALVIKKNPTDQWVELAAQPQAGPLVGLVSGSAQLGEYSHFKL